ncbi:MAG: Hint domain-containing protein [Pseudomonadota bacterium]
MGQVFIDGDTTGNVTEGSGVDATGTLNSTEIDTAGFFNGGPLFLPIEANWIVSDPPDFGTVSILGSPGETITWVYELDDTNPAVADLVLGDSLADSFVIQATDTSGGLGPGFQTIDITIFGVCFANGTLIETETGLVRVEDLALGMQVMTRDGGFQPIVWLGGGPCPEEDWQQDHRLKPVRIRAGALGHNNPAKDLYVSQNHRILIRSVRAELFFGDPEVLVAAKHLSGLPGIEIVPPEGMLSYHHILCGAHHILSADGCPAESMLLGDEALVTLAPEDLAALDALLQCEGTYQGDPDRMSRACRRILSRHEAALIFVEDVLHAAA